MDPKFGDLFGFFEIVRASLKDTLEHSSQVADVELIVEVSSGLLELVADFLMQVEGTFAKTLSLFGDVLVEVLEVVGDECFVDADQ